VPGNREAHLLVLRDAEVIEHVVNGPADESAASITYCAGIIVVVSMVSVPFANCERKPSPNGRQRLTDEDAHARRGHGLPVGLDERVAAEVARMSTRGSGNFCWKAYGSTTVPSCRWRRP